MDVLIAFGTTWTFFWDTILFHPIVNILLLFYKLAELAHLPGPMGWAIIVLTLILRLAVYPFYQNQIRHQKKLQELKPQLDALKREHGSNRLRHQQEVQKLYKEAGVNPAGGLLPVLIQLPVLLGLYNAIFNIVSKSTDQALTHINNVAYTPLLHLTSLDKTFLGFNLSLSPSSAGLISALLIIPIVTGALQLVLAKMTTPPPSPKDSSKEESFEDALASSQSSLLWLMPLMTAYFAYQFPLGLALYWNVANIFAIVQQYLTVGPGGLASWLPKKT